MSNLEDFSSFYLILRSQVDFFTSGKVSRSFFANFLFSTFSLYETSNNAWASWMVSFWELFLIYPRIFKLWLNFIFTIISLCPRALFKVTASLKYNSKTINFTPKVYIHFSAFSYIHRAVQSSPLHNLRTFSSPQEQAHTQVSYEKYIQL